MTLPIIWRLAALDDLTEIATFIAERDEEAAYRMRRTIEESVLPAASYPYVFRAGRVSGTREIVAHPNYIVVYRVAGDCIDVVGVVHARQDYPRRDA